MNKRTLLNRKKQAITLCSQHDLSQIDIVECEKEFLMLSQMVDQDSLSFGLSTLIDQAKSVEHHRLFSGSYGSMIAVEKLLIN